MTVVKNIPYWLFGMLLVLVLGCDSDAAGTDIDEDVPDEEEILPLLFDPTVYTPADLSEEDLTDYNEIKNNPKAADLSIVRIPDHLGVLQQPKFVIQIPNGPRFVAITQLFVHKENGRAEWEGQIKLGDEEGFSLLGGSPTTIRGFIWADGQGYAIQRIGEQIYVVNRYVEDNAESIVLPLLFEPSIYSPTHLSETSLGRYNNIIVNPETVDVFIVKVSQAHLTLQHPNFIINLPNGVRVKATTLGTTISSGAIIWSGRADLCSRGDMNEVLVGSSGYLSGDITICGTGYTFQDIGDNFNVVHRTNFIDCECEGKAIRE